MTNRITRYLPADEPVDPWTAWAERVADDLAHDAEAVEDGDMTPEEFDEKW